VMNQSISSLTLLNTSGISNYSSGINITDIAQLLNSSWTEAADGSLTLNLAVNGGAGWGFTNLNDITQNGSINISGLYLENTNVTSNNGSITLTNGAVSLNNNSLSAANGTITVDGKFVHLVNSSATAQDISLTGNASIQTGVLLNNATLNATQGNITLNGSSSGKYSVWDNTHGNYGAGITLAGNTSLNASHIVLNATNTNQEKGFDSYNNAAGLMILGCSTISFTGNTAINTQSENGSGIYFKTNGGQSLISTLKFNNGTATINATSNAAVPVNDKDSEYYSAITFDYWEGPTLSHAVFDLNNSNLSITATSANTSGIAGNDGYPQKSSLTFQGTGNVSINASGKEGGIKDLQVNNTNLSGSTTITGSSTGSSSNGTGVGLTNSTLSNTTITG
ncbi:TPA: hypothetical protein J1Z12_004587, partial [Escherichia coli]|nr:hypothetical protein [Escherichia coli]HAZ3600663.1 hypothetical protein [Escherichia coli]